MSDTPSTPPPSQEVVIAATLDNGNDSGTSSGFPDPNPQEAMFFFNMIKNMNNIPDIDWEGVAADSGFKNAAVAKIKQKLGLDARTNTTVVKPKSPPKTPAKPRKRKAKGDDTEETVKTIEAAADGDGDAKEDALPPTPPKTPKRRKTATKAAKVKAEIEADVTDANKSEDKTDTKTDTDTKSDDKTEVTEPAKTKVEPAEANVKKGRKPLPRGRVQQQTPSESGGEEENVQREVLTAVLPSIEVNTGADMEGTV